MSPTELSSIEARLARLAIEPRRDLLDRVVAYFASVDSPVGGLFVAWTESGICAVAAKKWVEKPGEFITGVNDRTGRPVVAGEAPPAIARAARSGDARQLRFDLSGLTPFESDVLATTRRIPRGEVRPYAWVAAEIGKPKAVRAVGSALGRNPVPFLIPCHRVTRSDGTIGNYGGGPEMKEELLRAEKVNLDEVLDLARHGVHFVGCTTTKIVCFPSCAAIRRVAPVRWRVFRSVEEASAFGFRPCKRCRPGLAESA